MKKAMIAYAAVAAASLMLGCTSVPFTNMKIVTDKGTAKDKPGEVQGGTNAAERLQHLKELKDKGLISDEEYQQKRKTIVDEL